MEELDGLEVNDLLSNMFTATDRLRRDVHDGPAVLAAVEHGRRIAGVATPSVSVLRSGQRCASDAKN